MAKRITEAQAFRQLMDAWDNVLTGTFSMLGERESRAFVKAFLGRPEASKDNDPTEATRVVSATAHAMFSRDIRRAVRLKAKDIKTEEQLETALAQVRHMTETFPTEARKELKKFMATLPRRGGPGRSVKLTEERAKEACDRIGDAIRDGDSTKAALARVSAESLSLWGTTISPRTLQKAWNSRAKKKREEQ